MGTSFTAFQGRGFWASDSSLEVWLYLLASEINSMLDVPDWLAQAQDEWLMMAQVGLVGSIHADLDGLLTTPQKKEQVIKLAQQTITSLEAHGPLLSQERLNAMNTGGSGSYFTRDVETDLFLQIGKAFVSLLKGELSTDSSTSPTLPLIT